MAASIASASVRAVKGKRLIPARAALVLTQAAVTKIKEILVERPDAIQHFPPRGEFVLPSAGLPVKVIKIGLKVGVRQRGCNGLSYTLDYAKEKSKFDEEVLQDGVCVIIDKKAQLSLLGTEMDYSESKLSSEFIFNNPNIKGTCGCGESFSI